jgi:hypothetical protein
MNFKTEGKDNSADFYLKLDWLRHANVVLSKLNFIITILTDLRVTNFI